MDPDEVMRLLRGSMLEISDLVGGYLGPSGSALTQAEIEQAVESAEAVVKHGRDLLEWLNKGGYAPGSGGQ